MEQAGFEVHLVASIHKRSNGGGGGKSEIIGEGEARWWPLEEEATRWPI